MKDHLVLILFCLEDHTVVLGTHEGNWRMDRWAHVTLSNLCIIYSKQSWCFFSHCLLFLLQLAKLTSLTHCWITNHMLWLCLFSVTKEPSGWGMSVHFRHALVMQWIPASSRNVKIITERTSHERCCLRVFLKLVCLKIWTIKCKVNKGFGMNLYFWNQDGFEENLLSNLYIFKKVKLVWDLISSHLSEGIFTN